VTDPLPIALDEISAGLLDARFDIAEASSGRCGAAGPETIERLVRRADGNAFYLEAVPENARTLALASAWLDAAAPNA
jgi:hypothetical protein